MCVFRVQISENDEIVHRNQPAGWTSVRNYIYGRNESNSTVHYAAQMYCQLRHLLSNRFGKWFVWIAISIVVIFYHENPRFYSKLFVNFMKWSLNFLRQNRFPFDSEHNPIGYFIAFVIEYLLIGYEYFIIACTLSLGIGAFWLAIPATQEIQHILHLINDEVYANENQSNELKLLFSDFVNIHGIAKQLSNWIFLKVEPYYHRQLAISDWYTIFRPYSNR